MSDINECTFTGRVGAQPELKHTAGGVPTCAFPLAVERTKAEGAEKAEVDWITLVAWNRAAEVAAKYLTKGTFLAVSCAVRTRKWQDKAGQMRKETEFRVLNFRMAGTRPNTEPPKNAGNAEESYVELPDTDEDLPF